MTGRERIAAPMTTSMKAAADIAAQLRARNPVIWVVSREEARVEEYIVEAAASAGYKSIFWDVAQGLTTVQGDPVDQRDPEGTLDPDAALKYINDKVRGAVARAKAPNRVTDPKDNRTVWIMRDMAAWLQPPIGLTPQRRLRNIAKALPGLPLADAQTIVILSTNGNVPDELADNVTVVEWPLPDREEVADLLDGSLEVQSDKVKAKATKAVKDAAIDAAVGLTQEEAQACFARSFAQLRAIDPVLIAGEKKRVITKAGVLRLYDPIPGGLDAVGGLDVLKAWLVSRGDAYTDEARAYQLPAPRGAMLVGIPGCGKTLTARAIGTAWNVPIITLDLGALKSKYVGESEGNLRRALQVVEAVDRCVLVIDEIEKGLAGATQGAADGGVSSDALGALLSWMQDRKGRAFVLATANDVSALPPELMRKGRFDRVWFVDTPSYTERIEVLKASMATHGRAELDVDFAKVANATEGFTGAELASLMPEALFMAFADGKREPTTRDLLTAAKDVNPMAKDNSNPKIARLRDWVGQGNATRASSDADVEEVAAARPRGRRAIL